MFWIQQLPHLSLEKPSIVSPWPGCVSWLQSLWRIDLLFYSAPFSLWPLLRLPCPVSSTKYKRRINKCKGWLNADSWAADRNVSASLKCHEYKNTSVYALNAIYMSFILVLNLPHALFTGLISTLVKTFKLYLITHSSLCFQYSFFLFLQKKKSPLETTPFFFLLQRRS